jgi:hypothetical protein
MYAELSIYLNSAGVLIWPCARWFWVEETLAANQLQNNLLQPQHNNALLDFLQNWESIFA